MKSKIKDNLKYLLNKVELRANYLYKYHYRKYIHMDYNKLMLENLMCNGHCHLVAVFKNYLAEDDNSEYLRRFYRFKESVPRLKKLFSYHVETTVIFPNFTPLFESKYLYNNVIRKQRIIDAQQNLEVKKNHKKSKQNKDFFNKEDKIFNSTIFEEILTQNESVLRIVFGIEKKQQKLKDKYISLNNIQDDKIETKENNNINSNENSNYSDCKELKQLIKHVENAEKNINIEEKNIIINNKSISIKETLKLKLKLINTPNIDQKKHKNLEKLNSITNNSTNSITSSSNNNNINYNINLKKIQNKPKDFKNNILESIEKLKFGKNILENRKNLDSNKRHEKPEYIKSKNNLTISSNVKSKSHIPNRTLYCSKFHISKNKLNNLMSQEKKLRIKNNSNSYINNNTSRTKTNINYNNNNNFYHIINKKIKSNKLLNEIQKNDINKLDTLFKNDNKILTISNKNSNKNRNYILNNPNLFFAETEILKTERNIMKKRTHKKDIIKNFINQAITNSPSNSKSKGVFGRNNNRKIFTINKPNLKSITQSINNKLYFSNKNINTILYESPKKLLINEYNFKANSKNNKYKK